MSVNITNLSNIGSIEGMGEIVNAATEGLFWLLILVVIFSIYVYNTWKEGVEKSVAIAGSICFLLSLFLLYLEWVTLLAPIIFALILAGTLAYVKFT